MTNPLQHPSSRDEHTAGNTDAGRDERTNYKQSLGYSAQFCNFVYGGEFWPNFKLLTNLCERDGEVFLGHIFWFREMERQFIKNMLLFSDQPNKQTLLPQWKYRIFLSTYFNIWSEVASSSNITFERVHLSKMIN